jgi:hypothetical protein
MLRISKHTQLKPADVIEKASRFFGDGGEGLDETQRTPCCISFEGAGGYLTVSMADEENRRSVDIETREFEYPAKKFLGKL